MSAYVQPERVAMWYYHRTLPSPCITNYERSALRVNPVSVPYSALETHGSEGAHVKVMPVQNLKIHVLDFEITRLFGF